MLLSADAMRMLLLLGALGMALLGAFFLRRRRMTLLQYLGWGILAVLLPLVGPFLVIVLAPGRPPLRLQERPGRRRPLRQFSHRLRRLFL